MKLISLVGGPRTETDDLYNNEPMTLPFSSEAAVSNLRYAESSAPSGLGRVFKPMTWEMWKREHREIISKRRAANKRARAARKKQRRRD